jgi:hypothetical protein
MRVAVSFLLVLAACKNDGAADPAPKSNDLPPGTKLKLAGVYPENWKCDSIMSLDALGQVLGGTPRAVDQVMPVPRGVPQPCNYRIDAQDELWTFDVDCRDDYKRRADALFEQYQATSAQLVEQYNTTTDAGVKPPPPPPGVDAGLPGRPPSGAIDVQVGSKGLDHHGQGLLFIDDDAPCYVRVIGPDATRRLELAKLVTKNRTFENAPMKPRPMR